MEFKDYYRVLGVERSADAKAVSRAFKRLARQFHPDVNKAAGAEERFKEINEAYQVLGGSQKRARYDQIYEAYQRGGVNWQDIFRGAPGPRQQAPGGFTVVGDIGDLEDLLGGLGGFSDFFEQFFGGGGGSAGRGRRARPGQAPGDDIFRQARPHAEAILEVTLEETIRGAHRPVTVNVNGTVRQLDVTVPRGVRDGQQIRLPGALDGGDLYLRVRVKPHPHFEVKGDGVLIEVPVTLPEALLGAEIEVPTLEGKVSMKVPAESQNGRTFRLRGLGLPRRDGGRGDQLVRLKVVLPERLDDRERKFFEEMRRRRRDNPRGEF